MPRWAGCVFALLFVLHCANYLYFFVDDEAIPYVFAQNLLNGNGLRYNSFEGPVEGYSDFLQVLVATAILEVVHLLQLDKLHVFTINKAWSLACGVGVVWLTFGMLRRLPGIRAPGLVAGMSFVVLAGTARCLELLVARNRDVRVPHLTASSLDVAPAHRTRGLAGSSPHAPRPPC